MTSNPATGSQSTAALVFDFDGTILDTETPVYQSWHDTFVVAEVEPISLEVWLRHIGRADGDGLDVRAALCDRLGVSQVPQALEDYRRERRDEMLAELAVRDGVLEWIEAAHSAGIKLAVASSSPTGWVAANLDRVGLTGRFEALSCADPPIPGKPDPTVYLNACDALAVEPGRALAIEDSPTGVRAAVDAGLRCIAAPGPITAGGDFSHADLHVGSLVEASPAAWL